MTMKVRADKYKTVKANMDKMGYPADCEPVGLYGGLVPLDKDDPNNLGKMADDIQDRYGLTDSYDNPNGGLAVEDEDGDY